MYTYIRHIRWKCRYCRAGKFRKSRGNILQLVARTGSWEHALNHCRWILRDRLKCSRVGSTFSHDRLSFWTIAQDQVPLLTISYPGQFRSGLTLTFLILCNKLCYFWTTDHRHGKIYNFALSAFIFKHRRKFHCIPFEHFSSFVQITSWKVCRLFATYSLCKIERWFMFFCASRIVHLFFEIVSKQESLAILCNEHVRNSSHFLLWIHVNSLLFCHQRHTLIISIYIRRCKLSNVLSLVAAPNILSTRLSNSCELERTMRHGLAKRLKSHWFVSIGVDRVFAARQGGKYNYRRII